MTLPPVVRVFFALALPPHIIEQMAHVIGDLKKITKKHAIRFTKPENLHITLQFVGEVPVANLDDLIKMVRESLAQQSLELCFEFSKVSLFPNPFRPRVIVLEVALEEKMANLSKAIGAGIANAGYTLEKRTFRGHMTLGRIKQPREIDLRCLAQLVLPDLEPIKVNEVILFRSEPHPEGSHYTVLEKLALSP